MSGTYASALSGRPPAKAPTGGSIQRQPIRRDPQGPPDARLVATDAAQLSQGRAEYRPATLGEESHVYVLTLSLTPSLFNPINALRKKHFPQKLNRIPAHLTLFHALPGSQLQRMLGELDSLASATEPFRMTTGKPFRLRRGVGINVGCGMQEAKALHGQLRTTWASVLSEQDRGGWRPHWTVQNKVDEERQAADAFAQVEREFGGAEGRATGLALWRYDRGRWELERELGFKGGERRGGGFSTA